VSFYSLEARPLMSVEQLIAVLKERGSQLRPPISVGQLEPMAFTCTFSQQSAVPKNGVFVRGACPESLARFWRVAEWAKLFEDRAYGQWGLHVLTPAKAQTETKKRCAQRPHAFDGGDLVVGRFLGDCDLLLVRCDETAPDYGNVLIALPLDPREDWYHVGETFGEFLEAYVSARGDKFWEHKS
jgi:hypothetical protein